VKTGDMMAEFVTSSAARRQTPLVGPVVIQGDQNVSVHLMITVLKTGKNIFKRFNYLP
jgi:hypothetical protein